MNDAIIKFLQTLRRTKFMPARQLQDYQRGLLESLVRHAQASVPFYRDTGRLKPIFAPDGSIDWSRWGEIPRLTRKELQQNFEALKSELLPPEHGQVRATSTSGTTGEPVTVLHSELSERIAWSALTLRDFEAHSIDATKHLGYLYPFTPSDFETGHAREHKEWYAGFASLGFPGTRTDISDTQSSSSLVDTIASLKPNYLRVQPVALELMCAHDSKELLSATDLTGIISVGEYFEGNAKSEIERQLSCKIVEVYGSSECGRMATTCAECSRYHINAETVFLEIINDDGSPTAAGDAGWALATPLYNYALPLVRYDHGDEARPGQQGGCSIQLPSLEAIYGKRRTPFVFPNGMTIRPTLPPRTVVEYLGAEAFQFVQTAPDRCEIRFVPGRISTENMRFDDMTEFIRSIWWGGLTVDYRMMDRLPTKSRHSKTARFVQEMPIFGRMTDK